MEGREQQGSVGVRKGRSTDQRVRREGHLEKPPVFGGCYGFWDSVASRQSTYLPVSLHSLYDSGKAADEEPGGSQSRVTRAALIPGGSCCGWDFREPGTGGLRL